MSWILNIEDDKIRLTNGQFVGIFYDNIFYFERSLSKEENNSVIQKPIFKVRRFRNDFVELYYNFRLTAFTEIKIGGLELVFASWPNKNCLKPRIYKNYYFKGNIRLLRKLVDQYVGKFLLINLTFQNEKSLSAKEDNPSRYGEIIDYDELLIRLSNSLLMDDEYILKIAYNNIRNKVSGKIRNLAKKHPGGIPDNLSIEGFNNHLANIGSNFTIQHYIAPARSSLIKNSGFMITYHQRKNPQYRMRSGDFIFQELKRIGAVPNVNIALKFFGDKTVNIKSAAKRVDLAKSRN